MCMVHNAIFRGYNSIYRQAPHVAEADKADFVGYCLAWYKFLKTHTTEEESGLFPMAEKLLGEPIFQGEHAEHGERLVLLLPTRGMNSNQRRCLRSRAGRVSRVSVKPAHCHGLLGCQPHKDHG